MQQQEKQSRHDEEEEEVHRLEAEHAGCCSYDGALGGLRELHLPLPARRQHTYVDYAGGALASPQVLAQAHELLAQTLLANPHSEGAAAARAAEWAVQQARSAVLQLAGLDPRLYACAWTPGATGAMRLLADALPWQPGAVFAPHQRGHNSLLGIRCPAVAAGARYAPWQQPADALQPAEALPASAPQADEAVALVAAPLVCNFSGAVLPLQQLLGPFRQAAGRRWLLLVDAAAALGRMPLGLAELQPDYVAVSVQKALGWPAGVGALLVRRGEPLAALLRGRQRAFGGGAVGWAGWRRADAFAWSDDPLAALEAGSLPYASLAALPAAARALLQLPGGLPAVQRHLGCLARHTAAGLARLRHSSGAPVCRVLGEPGGPQHAAGIVAFVLLRADGGPVRLADVQQLAALEQITLRVGVFCNPGAAEHYLGLDDEQLQAAHAAGHRCGADDPDSTRPLGAVRVSFGPLSSFREVCKLLRFVQTYFVDATPTIPRSPAVTTSFALRMTRLLLYPIKSCAPFEITTEAFWPLSTTGLLYDREFAVIDATDERMISLKSEPGLARIRPRIDLNNNRLMVYADGHDPLTISLGEQAEENMKLAVLREKVGAQRYDNATEAWFSTVLQRPVTLVRRSANRKAPERKGKLDCAVKSGGDGDSISLVNEGQFLIISEESVADVNSRLAPADRIDVLRFRPNIVLAGFEKPYEEDFLRTITIGGLVYSVVGPCSRCMMVNIDPKSGTAPSREPLHTLASFRRKDSGMIAFGMLISAKEPPLPARLSIFSPVVADFGSGE